jgi:hypothetical protein
MDARTRTILEMGKRALAFAEAHPEQSPANLPALSRLKEILARSDKLIMQQRDGISEVRAATGEKREIRRKIRRTHLPHLSRVAEAAGVERPELAKKLELPSEALPYLAFRSAVQGILTEAGNEKVLLAKFGMVDPRRPLWPRRSRSSTVRSSEASPAGGLMSAPERSWRRRRTR